MENLEQQNYNIKKCLDALIGEDYSKSSRKNVYSLEEASTIAYIEIFGKDYEDEYKKIIYDHPGDRIAQLHIRKKLHGGTDKAYSNFKKKYKKCIDTFLKNLLGDEYGLEMFRVLDDGSKVMYGINRDDIILFNRVFFAYYPETMEDLDGKDYKNLKNGKFDSITLERIKEWRTLIKDMYNYHETELTADDVEKIINDRFNVWKREFFEAYNHFEATLSGVKKIIGNSRRFLNPVKEFTQRIIQLNDEMDKMYQEIYDASIQVNIDKKKKSRKIIESEEIRRFELREKRCKEEKKKFDVNMRCSKYIQESYKKEIELLQNRNAGIEQDLETKSIFSTIYTLAKNVCEDLMDSYKYYSTTDSSIAKIVESEFYILYDVCVDAHEKAKLED